MAVWSRLGSGTRAAALAGGTTVAAVTGWLVWQQASPVAVPLAVVPDPQAGVEPVSEAAAGAAVAVEPVAKGVAVEPAAAEPATDEPAATELLPATPRFDVVRVEPDGSATVAGRAAPGAAVSLLVDGVEVAQARADGQGGFASLFTLPASAAPRLLSLVAVLPDGASLPGPDSVALAATAPAESAAAPVDPAPAVAQIEPEAPAALLLTEDGVKVLQPGADVPAELAANVSIDTISYAPDGAVQLGGRGTGAAFVRLYLNDAEQATVLVAQGGQWAAVLSDVAPGLYTLRADQIGVDGKVTSRFETPFKRETLEALAQAAAPVPIAEAEPEVAPVVDPAAADPVQPEVAAVGPAPATEPAAVDPAIAAESAAIEPAAAEPVAAVSDVAEPLKTEPATAKPGPVTVTVQPGFTLWGIAQENFGDGVLYVQVFAANKDKIRDPDLIYPGQVFAIPAP